VGASGALWSSIDNNNTLLSNNTVFNTNGSRYRLVAGPAAELYLTGSGGFDFMTSPTSGGVDSVISDMTTKMSIDSQGQVAHSTNTGSCFSSYLEAGVVRGYVGASNSIVAGGLSSMCLRGDGGIILSIGGNQSMVINTSGHPFFPFIRNSAGSYTAKITAGSAELTFDTSSARYKDNIRDSDYGLSAVMQLQSRMFEYKDDVQRTDVGFIAEEVNEVIPELVVIDAEGRPDAVNYDRMTSVLLKGMQEQQAIIEALTARIEALEGA